MSQKQKNEYSFIAYSYNKHNKKLKIIGILLALTNHKDEENTQVVFFKL